MVVLQFQQALERVRAGADVMPKRQLEKVISAEAGPDWRSKVATFEDEPLAAASIGQVSPMLITFQGMFVVLLFSMSWTLYGAVCILYTCATTVSLASDNLTAQQ